MQIYNKMHVGFSSNVSDETKTEKTNHQTK